MTIAAAVNTSEFLLSKHFMMIWMLRAVARLGISKGDLDANSRIPSIIVVTAKLDLICSPIWNTCVSESTTCLDMFFEAHTMLVTQSIVSSSSESVLLI